MKNPKIIVSMTSFPAAITFAAKAVESVLRSSIRPDKIVLYLADPQFPGREIPSVLAALRCDTFEIRFCKEDIRSYKKLIPALEDFPDDIIITVDDDVDYNKNMIKKLLWTHKKYPDAIVSHRVRRIQLGKPYIKWKVCRGLKHLFRASRPSFSNLQIGNGGVLYPPRSLKPEMLDSKLFMKIAPTVDDIWFWAAAAAQGTKVAPVLSGYTRPRDLGKPKEIRLQSTNWAKKSGRDVNREVLEEILEKYPDVKKRLHEGKDT